MEERWKNTAEREAVCKKCGNCCRKKTQIGKKVIYLPYWCQYLDTTTRLCRVYSRRHEVHPGCKTIDEAIKMGILPADCAYVQGLKDYKAPVEDWDSPEAAAILSQFAKDHTPEK